MEFLGTVGNKRAGTSSGRSGRSVLGAWNKRVKVEIGLDPELQSLYPDVLNFYMTPPTYSISLEEFEKYAVERLKLLRLLESYNTDLPKKVDADKKPIRRYSEGYFGGMISEIDRNRDNIPTYYYLFSRKTEIDDMLQACKIDHISHFLLRLAFSRTDELRKWFMSLEIDLFRLKLYHLRSSNAVANHKLPYEQITQDEKMKYSKQIGDSSYTVQSFLSPSYQVFKIHFTQALDLVRTRKVFLRKGYAYVLYSDLAEVISLKFRTNLSESLSILKKNIHLVEDDERLRPLIYDFEKRHLGTDSRVMKSGDVVTAAQLPVFAEKSFPLCMKHLHDVVQKDHHLKHWGRLQLGLFFKGLGLPMDEATKYWRSNFTKRVDIDSGRFDKQYLYNIRHMYGQEGKRADYTPYSCMKVISSSVGPGDHHGCPFRHSDATPLRVKFVEAGINQQGIKEIMKLVDQKHYQIACQKYFEYTHDSMTIDGGVNHPNQYFLESRNILTGKKTVKTEGGAVAANTTRCLVYPKKEKRDDDESEPMQVTEGIVEDMMDDDDIDISQLEY